MDHSAEYGGITGRWVLDGWDAEGLFGHMWLHAGLLHLIGNLVFLWLFGNAVCSKIGNVIYLPIYILCGLAAALSHLLFFDFDTPMLGASGAINGMVGMYLVFFPENSISCFFMLYFRPIWFTVRSFWMILFWFVFDIWGAMRGGGGVAYFAHIGGFVSGFAIAVLLLKTKTVVMERDETSLFKLLGLEKSDSVSALERLGDPALGQQGWRQEEGVKQAVHKPPAAGESSEVLLHLKNPEDFIIDSPEPRPASIRFTCSCGRRVKIPAKYAGLTGRCPHCSARLKIPSSGENKG
jgi:membrane associated rhomboid family serine protease